MKPKTVDEMSCAFVPCASVAECPLIGGCISRPGHQFAKPTSKSTVAYNPMTGTRLDLVVTDEPTGVAEKRWTKGRVAYLQKLLKGDLSDDARLMYQRELDALLTTTL